MKNSNGKLEHRFTHRIQKKRKTCDIIVLTLPPMKAQLAAFMKQI